MSQISPEGSAMSCPRVEARSHIETIIGPIHPSANLKSLLPRVAHMLRFTASRVAKMWARDARIISSVEMDRLREEARKAELLRTATQLDGAAHALLALDIDRNREEVARLRDAAAQYRNLARSKGEG